MVIKALNDFVVVLMLVLELLDFLVLLAEMVFEGFDTFAQAHEFGLEDFDNGMVGEGFHELRQCAGILAGQVAR